MANIAPAAPAVVLLPGTTLGCRWRNCRLPSVTATSLPPFISSASNRSGATLPLSLVPFPTTITPAVRAGGFLLSVAVEFCGELIKRNMGLRSATAHLANRHLRRTLLLGSAGPHKPEGLVCGVPVRLGGTEVLGHGPRAALGSMHCCKRGHEVHKGVLPIGGMGKRTSKLVGDIGFCINSGLDSLFFPLLLLAFVVTLSTRWHLNIGRH